MNNFGIWVGLGRDFADFPDFSRNDPKWSPRALGLLFGGLGVPGTIIWGSPGVKKAPRSFHLTLLAGHALAQGKQFQSVSEHAWAKAWQAK